MVEMDCAVDTMKRLPYIQRLVLPGIHMLNRIIDNSKSFPNDRAS
jgi:hypothetical protein